MKKPQNVTTKPLKTAFFKLFNLLKVEGKNPAAGTPADIRSEPNQITPPPKKVHHLSGDTFSDRAQLDFWLLCFGQLLLFVGFFSFFQFPLYIKALGGGEVSIGVIMGVTSLASTLLLPWITALVDRFERRGLMLTGAIMLECANILAMTTSAPNTYMALIMLLRGLGFTVYLISSGAYVAQIIPVNFKAKYIGINFGFNQVAIGVGPLIGEIMITRVNFPFFFFMSTAFVYAGLLLMLTISRQYPTVPPPSLNPVRSLTRFFKELISFRLRMSFLSILMLAAALGAIFNFTATYTALLGLSSGVFFMVYALSNAASRFFGAGLADRYGRGLVIVPTLLMMALGTFWFGLISSVWEMVIVGLLIGVGFGLSNPALLAKMLDRTPPGSQSLTIGTFHFAYQLGLLCTPPVYGLIADNWGYTPMWDLAAFITLLALVIYMLPERPYHPEEHIPVVKENAKPTGLASPPPTANGVQGVKEVGNSKAGKKPGNAPGPSQTAGDLSKPLT